MELVDLAADEVAKDSETSRAESLDGSTQLPQSKKRKRQTESTSLEEVIAEEDELAPPLRPGLSLDQTSRHHSKPTIAGVHIPNLVYPKSQYLGWEPPLPKTREFYALQDLWVCHSLVQYVVVPWWLIIV